MKYNVYASYSVLVRSGFHTYSQAYNFKTTFGNSN